MTLRIDFADGCALLGASLVLLGLGLIAWPLILVGVGAALLGYSLWRVKWAASSPGS